MKKQLCSTRGSHIEGDFWTAVRNGVNAVVRYYNEEISKGGKA